VSVRGDLFGPALEARLAPLIGGYHPLPGVYDEMMEPGGRVRPVYQPFLDMIEERGAADFQRRTVAADTYLRESGVFYRVYDDEAGEARSFPLSHVPLLVSAEEWRDLAAGLAERASLLDRILGDIYGPGRLVADRVLPAAAVAGSPDFLRPLVGVAPRGGSHLRLYAADIGRGPDGRWWVLSDRTQAPSGAGYALETRLAMARALPDFYAEMNVERLAGFFQTFRAGLSVGMGAESRVCVLTPGQLNETYFEHAYLARYLGFILVEGADLTVRDGELFIRTVSGLRKAEVLWRRLDADFADPLELATHSRLGVPGLVGAVRAGSVTMVNALGSGAVEARSLLGFLPGVSRHLDGHEPVLPHVATWWCGQAIEREAVLAALDSFVIAPAFGASVPGVLDKGPVVVADLAPEERARLADAIRRRGMDFVAQEIVKLSTMPVWREGRLEPRPFTLRVFLAKDGDGWTVMPGGFCRVADRVDARAVTMQRGGRTADVCVLSEGPVAPTTLLPSAETVRIRRHTGSLPSRAADNLFWLGRYIERCEATLRLLRVLGGPLVGAEDQGGEVQKRIMSILEAWEALPPKLLRPTPAGVAAAVLHRTDLPGGLLGIARNARAAASVIRDRFSPDAWRALSDLVDALAEPKEPGSREGEAFLRVEAVLRILSSFSGLAQENMNQLTGWRFLEIGRRLERGIATARFVARFGGKGASGPALDALLALCDSQITYRMRYVMVAARAPVLDLVVLDHNNPRSLVFQAARIAEHLTALPGHIADGRMSPPERAVAKLLTELRVVDPEDVDVGSMQDAERALMSVSDLVSTRYFTLRDGRTAERADLE
jgi:uncharacterized circularly permuted ATP-grasp superfamily protein/uncharacterized alpha-E superfamily protein